MDSGWPRLFVDYYHTGDITAQAWQDFVEAGGPCSIPGHWNPGSISLVLSPPSTREAFLETYLCHYYSPARDGALEELMGSRPPYSFQKRLEQSLAALACADELTQAATILHSGLLNNKYLSSSLWLTVRYGSVAAMELLLHSEIGQRVLWQLIELTVNLGRWALFELLLSKISWSHRDTFSPAMEMVASLIKAGRLEALNFYLRTLGQPQVKLLPLALSRVLTNKYLLPEWYEALMHEWAPCPKLAVVFLQVTPTLGQLEQLLAFLDERQGVAAVTTLIEAALTDKNFFLGRMGKLQTELLWVRVQDTLGSRLKASFVKRAIHGNAYPVVRYLLEAYPLLSLEELAMDAFYAGGISDSIVALCRAGLALRQQQEPFLRWVVETLSTDRHLTLQEITLIECQPVEVLINVQRWLALLGLGRAATTPPSHQLWSMLQNPQATRAEFIGNVKRLLPRPSYQHEWQAAGVGLGRAVVSRPIGPIQTSLWRRCYLQRALYYPLATLTEGLVMEINQLFDHNSTSFLSRMLIYGQLETVRFVLNSLLPAQRRERVANLTRAAAFLGYEDALRS